MSHVPFVHLHLNSFASSWFLTMIKFFTPLFHVTWAIKNGEKNLLIKRKHLVSLAMEKVSTWKHRLSVQCCQNSDNILPITIHLLYINVFELHAFHRIFTIGTFFSHVLFLSASSGTSPSWLYFIVSDFDTGACLFSLLDIRKFFNKSNSLLFYYYRIRYVYIFYLCKILSLFDYLSIPDWYI